MNKIINIMSKKLNNKGFALTSIIYMLIVLFLMIMLLVLANLAQRKLVLDKLKNNVKKELNQTVNINSQDLPYQNITSGIYYETLELAFKHAKTGDTIKVLKDVEEITTATNTKGTTENPVVLDLNGKTITTSETLTNIGTLSIIGGGTIETNSTAPSNYRFIIQNNGTLSITETTLTSTAANSEYERGINLGSTTAKLTINAGTNITTTGISIVNDYSQRSTASDPAIYIAGGTITSKKYQAIWQSSPVTTGMVYITDGIIVSEISQTIYNNSTGKITISGGTITGGTGCNAVTNNSTGTVEISAGNISTTNKDAVANNSTGTLTITGGTITTTTGGAGVASANGNVTISGGKITAAGNGVWINKGNATIGNNNGTTQPEITGISVCGVNVYNTANVTILGGTINSESSYGVYNNSTGTVTIENANITSHQNSVINTKGITRILGGNFTATNSDAVRNSSTGTTTIAGGIFTSNTSAGISVGAGTVEVTGGTITGKTYGVWVNSSNSPTFTLGTNDGNVNTNSPQISAPTGEGVSKGTGSTFNFYDGAIIGKSNNSMTSNGTLVTPIGYSRKTVLDGTTETSTIGWATDSNDTLIVNDSTEYSKSNTQASNKYEEIKQYTINAPFAANEVYQLEVDAKGTGSMYNYFWGASGYWQVDTIQQLDGTLKTGTDGNNRIYLTNEWKHYEVRFTLKGTGNANVNKYLLFRVFGGNTAYIKNIKFYKINSGHKILIDPNGGTYNGTTAALTLAAATGQLMNVGNPTRSGYTFGGWLPTKQAYDATWVEVFYHNYGLNNRLFSSTDNWAEATGTDSVDKYSILGQLEKFRANTSSAFEFLLDYDEISGKYNRWRQTANPTTTTSSPGYTRDFTEGHINWTGNAWGGMARSSSSSTYIDGSPGDGTWFYAIGAASVWNSGIPGPNSTKITDGIHLWVKANNDLSNITSPVTGVVTNGTYITKHDVTLKAIWIPN